LVRNFFTASADALRGSTRIGSSLAKRPRRCGQPGEQGQTEDVLDLALRSDTLVERLCQEREAQPDDQAEHQPEHCIVLGLRTHLRRTGSGLYHLRLVAPQE
jgi:hypothetical protein